MLEIRGDVPDHRPPFVVVIDDDVRAELAIAMTAPGMIVDLVAAFLRRLVAAVVTPGGGVRR